MTQLQTPEAGKEMMLDALPGGHQIVADGMPQPLKDCLGRVALYWERIPLPALWNYPVDRPGGKRYVGPSTGFNALVLFDWLRGHAGYTYQLMTLGFSNEAGKLWGGHAWAYERDWLEKSNVTVVPLQRRPWWQVLLRRK